MSEPKTPPEPVAPEFAAQAQTGNADPLANWPSETLDKDGKVIERRSVKNGLPFMSNDKGFGYV